MQPAGVAAFEEDEFCQTLCRHRIRGKYKHQSKDNNEVCRIKIPTSYQNHKSKSPKNALGNIAEHERKKFDGTN